jgi:hypothetical protein
MAYLTLSRHFGDVCALPMKIGSCQHSTAGCRHFCSLCVEGSLATIDPKDLPVIALEELLNTPPRAPTIGLQRSENFHDPCYSELEMRRTATQ